MVLLNISNMKMTTYSKNSFNPLLYIGQSVTCLRHDLDAYYARLHRLTHDELRYTLRIDPKEVHGEGFPGKTFRVLKEKEVKQFGEYRTRRLVLDVWDEQG